MPKFVKGTILKIKKKKDAIRNLAKATTLVKSEQGLATFFSIYFWSIKAMASGKPSKWQAWAFRWYLIPALDGKSTCDDKGYEGVKIKRRAKLIHINFNKTKKVTLQNKKWLQIELNEYVANSYNIKVEDIDNVLGKVNDSKIEEDLMKFKREKKYSKLTKGGLV